MKHVLGCTGVLLGLMLLICSGVLMQARAGKAAPSVIFGSVSTGLGGEGWIYRNIGGVQQRISPLFDPTLADYRLLGTSAKRDWLYFYWYDRTQVPYDVGWYRVRANGQHWTPLVSQLWTGEISPDGASFVYVVLDQENGARVMKTPLPYGDPIPLTPYLKGQIFVLSDNNGVLINSPSVWFSEDGLWVYFHRCSPYICHIVRAHMEGGDYAVLTETNFPDGAALYTAKDDRWIVSSAHRLYLTREDGSEVIPIEFNPGYISDFAPMWLPQADLLLFSSLADQDITAAVHLDTGETAWVLSETHFKGVSPSQKWVLLMDDGLVLIRMRPDGSERTKLATLPSPAASVGWAADGAWIYLLFGSDKAIEGIWRMDIMTGEQRRLAPARWPTWYQNTWSSDHTHLIYADQRPTGKTLYLLNVLDGTVRRLTDEYPNNQFLAWGPDINRAWSPSSMVSLGVGFLGIPFIGRMSRKFLGRITH